MIKKIDYPPTGFDNRCIALGRNGCVNMIALSLLGVEHDKRLILQPVTSKGNLGMCQIEIPAGALTPLIDALKEWRQDCRRKRVG